MTKYWYVLALVAVATTSQTVRADEDDDEGMKMDDYIIMLEPYADKCDPKPEKEHMKELLQNKEEAAFITKCFRRCLLEKFQLVEDGDLGMRPGPSVELMGMIWADRDDDLSAIIERCNKEHATTMDKCENAHGVGLCVHRGLLKEGFDVPEIPE